ncbi:MAG: prolyl oligopeptidase family serine peptidase [Armatimonadota bacterium]
MRTALLALLLCLAAPVMAAPPLTLEELFPDKPYLGRTARALAWSHDERLLAYLWNPYDAGLRDSGGPDLWIWDRATGKSRPLTSRAVLRPFDRDLSALAEAEDKERTEQQRRASLSEEERRRLREADRKADAERKEPRPTYAGIEGFRWAEENRRIVFTYRGDLFELEADGSNPVPRRLTRTRDQETRARYVDHDRAIVFRRGDGIYRRPVAVAGIEEQLNPELPTGLRWNDWRLSPDGRRLLLVSSRRAGAPPRSVSYLTYRDRFAQPRTTERDTGDDPDANETVLWCVDVDSDAAQPPRGDGKPWEVHRKPAGEPGDLALAEDPFTRDGKRFAYAAWKRDKRELTVVVADPESKSQRTVHRDTSDGEHRSPSLADPFFSPDGKRLCVLLERSGYRHAWLIDPNSEGATQLTRGDFEVYPLRFTQDGTGLVVRTSRDSPARMEPALASIPDGVLTGLSPAPGRYAEVLPTKDARQVAAIRSAWGALPELVVADTEGRLRTLTESHAPEAADRQTRIPVKPFRFRNRHGQWVHGTLMQPPGAKDADVRPLLIYVYGGPLGEDHQVKDGSVDRFGIYCAETLGYRYAVVDPRGTSGYGAVFGKANYERPGVAQVEDLVDAVGWISAGYGVDKARVGLHGWSFGGFQTQMCLYTAPETFTLGIAGAGPTEWQNYNNWYVGGVIAAGRKADELDRYSLTKLAPGLKAPLLLLHGLEDTNVLAQDTIKVYRELLKAGKGPLVELVVDPTGGHGLGGDIDTRRRHEIYAGFLERRWGRAGAPVR